MAKVVPLQSYDNESLLRNLSDLEQQLRKGDIHSLALVYRRKDGSTRSFCSQFERTEIVSILEQLKFDVMITYHINNSYGHGPDGEDDG